jgi:dolichol-phosphate mannosyltransferase
MQISLILPTYNEKENIIPLVQLIHQELQSYPHEIIVADDNSSDGTYQALINLQKPYLKPILRTENRGFANSIRCGIEYATGDLIVVMDSDFNHQPNYLPFMIEALKYYDCVSASRFLYGGRMDSRIRHLLSWTFNIFVRLVTGGQITDSLYGYFAIKKDVIARVDFDKVFWGYGDYCIRLMFYLQQNGTSVLQFPAINGQRLAGEGNSKFLNVFWQYFKEVMKLTYHERMNPCIQK